MEVKIEKNGLQLRKRFRKGLAPKILSTELKEDNLSILCRYDFDLRNNSLPVIYAYALDAHAPERDWMRVPTNMKEPEGKFKNKFRLTIHPCLRGIYKVMAQEMGVASKLSYESVIVKD